MTNTRKAAPSGFTLLEVLIALAIVGLSMAAMSEALVTGFTQAGRAERESKAFDTARNALTLAVASKARPITLSTDLPGGLKRDVVVRERRDLVAATAPSDLVPYEIDVRVSWPEGHSRRSIALSTLRLGAAP
jgi:general secretion pathway protein I